MRRSPSMVTPIFCAALFVASTGSPAAGKGPIRPRPGDMITQLSRERAVTYLSFAELKRGAKKLDRALRGASPAWGWIQRHLLRRPSRRWHAVDAILGGHAPSEVAGMAHYFRKLFGKHYKGGSLRGAINLAFYGKHAHDPLRRLDDAHAVIRGLERGGDEGRVKANIDKVYALNRQRKVTPGFVTEQDLLSYHGQTTHSRVKLLVDGKQAFPSMFKALEAAKDHIHVNFYIIKDDKMGRRFAEVLMRKAKEGKEVRLMVDGIGSVQIPLSPQWRLMRRMKKAGVEVIRNHMISPFNQAEKLNHPDHRKIVIVDGRVGFTGGMNVANHYYSDYHDLMVRVEGDAVKQMQVNWMTMWMHLGGRFDRGAGSTRKATRASEAAQRRRFFPATTLSPSGQRVRLAQAIPGERNAIKETYLKRIASAKRSIYIENPYMTNPEIQQALIKAGRRGVDIRVVLPSNSDHGFSHLAGRAAYPEMIRAGVKIYEYPGFNHGKVMVVDNQFVTIGSSNLDDVALRHIYEMNLNVTSKTFAKDVMRRVFHKDLNLPKTKLMKAGDISTIQRIQGAFFNLFHDVI